MKKVQPGDPLRIPAATFNTFVDAAQDFLRRQRLPTYWAALMGAAKESSCLGDRFFSSRKSFSEKGFREARAEKTKVFVDKTKPFV